MVNPNEIYGHIILIVLLLAIAPLHPYMYI